MSLRDRSPAIRVRPPAQGSPAGAWAPAAAHSTHGPRDRPAHQPPVVRLRGRGARSPPSSVAQGTGPAPPGPAESSLASRRRPGPAPGVQPSRGAQPRVQRSSASPGPVANATRQQPTALGTASLVPRPAAAQRPTADAPPRGARITVPGSSWGGDPFSPWLRPRLSSPPRGATPSSANSTPLPPPGLTSSGVPPGVGFLPALLPRVS
ncbi:hypothetical protein NDU88_001719 [Pleurodeles waltl]|uniref:Uncharacterized protein n=1 Tax=Pleurodeles waltl TaxID=8319 RepID=A0AAV7RDU0_PLEWA|nr:hypothetical protein NDU88_001719 [Pleurodeles waltl]